MIKSNKILKIILAIFVVTICALPNTSKAVEGRGITLSPGIIEEILDPGTQKQEEITIYNNTGNDLEFLIKTEDFRAADDNASHIKLLGDIKGPYSLKDFLIVPKDPIFIKNGEKESFTVTIDLPKEISTGGLYASVLVQPKIETTNQTAIVPRLASLFYIGIKGRSEANGSILSFNVRDNTKTEAEKIFSISLQNNSDEVHLSSIGQIEIKNILGKTIDVIKVPNWKLMQNRVRNREIDWVKKGDMFGIYRAVLKLQIADGQYLYKRATFFEFSTRPFINFVIAILVILVIINLVIIRKSKDKPRKKARKTKAKKKAIKAKKK